MPRRLTNLAVGLTSLAAIAALLAGVPWALVRFVGNPLPSSIPSWERIAAALTSGRVDPQVVISLLAIIVWVTWAQLALGLLVEAAAALRGRAAPRLPVAPGAQRLAAQLITSASLILSTFGPARPALATDLASLDTPAVVVAAEDAALPISPDLTLVSQAVSAPPPANDRSLYTVQRGDTLWSIAERTLGDGAKWQRIRDLNVGHLQPDGTRLPEDLVEGLRPGWTLTLPDDAAPAPVTADTHVVAPGESLSTIADAAYGDPAAFPLIFQANRDRPQPDGGVLTDPDAIRPGWVLRLPTAPGDSGGITEPAPPGPGTTDASAAAMTQEPPSRDPDATRTSGDAETAGPMVVDGGTELLPDEQAAEAARTAAPAAPRPAPATAAPRETAMPGTVTTAPNAKDRESAPLAVPVTIGASSLVAGSLLWTLSRLRARQARRRGPGRDLPLPPRDLVHVERRLRRDAADRPVAWLDATLRLLTVRLRERGGEHPAVAPVALHVIDEAIEVLLSEPDLDPPPDFDVADGGYAWRLGPALTLEAVQQAAGDAPPIAPAMVTVGSTNQGPLLVNLEQLALLRVQGPEEPVQAFLSGLAVELATAPWAAGVTVHPVVADDDALARLPRTEAAAALDQLANRLQSRVEANRNALGGDASTVAARTAPDGDDWPATVVVLRDPPADPETLQTVAKAAQQPGSGLAMVVAGEVKDAPWRLQLRDDATATLEPLGMEFTVSGLDNEAAKAAAALLDVASADDITRPTPLPEGTVEEPQTGDVATTGDLPMALDPLPVEVAVLGPVTVTGWETADVRPKSVETIAYLAVQGRPVPTDVLRTALWPEGINYNTFKNVVSRTRQALGSDRTGNYHLPESKGGRYRIGPDVGCDWTRFRSLADAARSATSAQAPTLLRAALELVSARPFEGIAAGTYQWAFDEQVVSAIEVAVVDAANRLAELALESDDPDTAVWAARQGHLVVPDHEGLYRARMRAHAQSGDLDSVEQTFREALRAARAYDALDDVQPETQHLYEALTRPRAARGA
jgi:nucleoid-associated protein YgaU